METISPRNKGDTTEQQAFVMKTRDASFQVFHLWVTAVVNRTALQQQE